MSEQFNMVIPDTHLVEVAKAMAGETHVVPAYYGFSETLVTANITDTSLYGEYGTRIAVDMTRDANVISYSATKTGALVGTDGESITGLASLSASTAGTLMTETVVPTINQTDAFDVEFITTITYDRV